MSELTAKPASDRREQGTAAARGSPAEQAARCRPDRRARKASPSAVCVWTVRAVRIGVPGVRPRRPVLQQRVRPGAAAGVAAEIEAALSAESGGATTACGGAATAARPKASRDAESDGARSCNKPRRSLNQLAPAPSGWCVPRHRHPNERTGHLTRCLLGRPAGSTPGSSGATRMFCLSRSGYQPSRRTKALAFCP